MRPSCRKCFRPKLPAKTTPLKRTLFLTLVDPSPSWRTPFCHSQPYALAKALQPTLPPWGGVGCTWVPPYCRLAPENDRFQGELVGHPSQDPKLTFFFCGSGGGCYRQAPAQQHLLGWRKEAWWLLHIFSESNIHASIKLDASGFHPEFKDFKFIQKARS